MLLEAEEEYLLPLAKAGLSQGIAGLFIEAHPDPDLAKCDGLVQFQLMDSHCFISIINVG